MTMIKQPVSLEKGRVADAFETDSTEVVSEVERHARICAELGKMAPLGSLVVDYRVEGRQSFCSPVRGIIFATIEQSGLETGERVLQFSTAREAFIDPYELVDTLNAAADADRAGRADHVAMADVWHHDK